MSQESLLYDESESESSSEESVACKDGKANHSASPKSCSKENKKDSPIDSAHDLILSRQTTFNHGLNQFVNKDLWRATKFLTPRDGLNPRCKLAQFCYQSLHISGPQQTLWWGNSWGTMKKILSKKRTSIVQRIMKVFKGTKIP